MSLRDDIRAALERGDPSELEDLVADEPRSVRYLIALSYQADEAKRAIALQGIGLAARYHPRVVKKAARRLVWAMNDESGGNALSAPAVMLAIAESKPELLLPMVPDLIRLSQDEGLKDGLAATLRTISTRCPGKVGKKLQDALNERVGGDPTDDA